MKSDPLHSLAVNATDSHTLGDGSRIAVIGGGPAGSFFAFFALELAERAGIDIQVDIYEPRDFSQPAPKGCNMCGGIISESLVQNLATEGINIPGTVVQRGIDSYVLHTDVGDVKIATPFEEQRIGAVYRGPGPRDIVERKWGSFDHHVLQMAMKRGARWQQGRVDEVTWLEGRPHVKTKTNLPEAYDLLVVATGVNSSALKLFEKMGIGYEAPKTTKTFIREYFLGEELIGKTIGSSMHVFLLNIPRLEFAAIIPKGDYATVCMLGEDIDNELVDRFLHSAEVKRCMPPDWDPANQSCQCFPKIAIEGASQPFADRLIFVGDCGITRLYKDGIGAAYRTAKAAANTAIFHGVSETALRKHYQPACKAIATDNSIGKLTFLATRQIQKHRFARRAVVSMTRGEQVNGSARRMSSVLWDMFSGSAPYKEIFMRTLHPAFLGRLGWSLGRALLPFGRGKSEEVR